MFRKLFLIIALTVILTAVILPLTGCDSVRFAPSEPQKQMAQNTQRAAMLADAQGADPDSDLTRQLVTGTSVALNYTGLPKDPVIKDFDATADQAARDASKRPTAEEVFEAVDKGLSFAEIILIALGGTGGIGLGIAGLRKAAKVVSDLRQRAKEAEDQYSAIHSSAAEMIRAEQAVRTKLKDYGTAQIPASQILEQLDMANDTAQSPGTQKYVREVKAEI